MRRLVLLGSKGGPALRPGGPWPSSSLLELGGRTIVVDCGLGVTRGLVDAGIGLKALDLIFITHLHSDHVLELGPLIHTAWTAGLATPVEVFGPPGTGHYWRRFLPGDGIRHRDPHRRRGPAGYSRAGFDREFSAKARCSTTPA